MSGFDDAVRLREFARLVLTDPESLLTTQEREDIERAVEKLETTLLDVTISEIERESGPLAMCPDVPPADWRSV